MRIWYNHLLSPNQTSSVVFCDPSICWAGSRGLSLQTPHGVKSREKKCSTTRLSNGFLPPTAPPFWVGTVGAPLKCISMWHRSNQDRRICRHFGGSFKYFGSLGFVGVFFSHFMICERCCHGVVIILIWTLLMGDCTFRRTGKCYCSANAKLQPLLWCIIRMSCSSPSFSPRWNRLRWWLTKINRHANLLLHQGIRRVAGQLCKF